MNMQEFRVSIQVITQQDAYHRLCETNLSYDAARRILAAMHKLTIGQASDHLLNLAKLTGRKLKGMP